MSRQGRRLIQKFVKLADELYQRAEDAESTGAAGESRGYEEAAERLVEELVALLKQGTKREAIERLADSSESDDSDL